jgi:hypothetical protein
MPLPHVLSGNLGSLLVIDMVRLLLWWLGLLLLRKVSGSLRIVGEVRRDMGIVRMLSSRRSLWHAARRVTTSSVVMGSARSLVAHDI